ncbi:hypothetical protein SAMN05216516_103268 [Izhakiella capsodis]|uniref:Uncharacterized protein n=1 Tax=Izhakiella capsodis TaxID=1367852 RepID=A0A1I4X537_9GAMM|nr:hypothetical protein [Izhakiella capsodis]SFN20339.1 hypothetical protein SAMN05216516_103268 [Izhakiella capsodis]
MRHSGKVITIPVDTATVSNTVRRLRWLRKRDELKRNPEARFPIILYR